MNGEPPKESSGIPRNSDQITHETPTDLGLVPDSSHEPLSNKPRTPSGTGNPNYNYLLSVVHGVRSPHQKPPRSLNVGHVLREVRPRGSQTAHE